MTRSTSSLTPEFFAGYYAGDPDPWRFATSDYERTKYAATMAALPRAHYASGLEIGCSIGILTRQLAERCDTMLGLDVVSSVLDTARQNCASLPNIRFELAAVPTQWPEGSFDLIVLSEVLYFLDRADLAQLIVRVEGSLIAGGTIILVHWLGETNYPLTGDEAADGFAAGAAHFAQAVHRDRTADYRLDVLTRTP